MIPSKFCINPGESLDFFLEDERQTHALGRVLADRLKSGDIVYLKGEMGVGKSALARSVIQSLYPEIIEVPSPTFSLVQLYEGGALGIAHLDLYRLDTPDAVYELGLDELASSYALLIEWPERLAHLGFDHHLEIVLKEAGAVQRTVSIRCHGNFRLG